MRVNSVLRIERLSPSLAQITLAWLGFTL